MTEELRNSAPLEDFLVRGGSVPVDLPVGIINPAAISSLIEQKGGEVGHVLTIAPDGIARWIEITAIPGPGGLPILSFPKNLGELLDVTLAGENTCDVLVFTGAFWTNSPITKTCLPSEIPYEDEVNDFTENNSFKAVLRAVKTVTPSDSPYAIQIEDWHINAAAITKSILLTLPDATTSFVGGKSAVLTVKKTGPSTQNDVTIQPSVSGQRVDGETSCLIRRPYKSLTFVTDGSDWFIQ